MIFQPPPHFTGNNQSDKSSTTCFTV